MTDIDPGSDIELRRAREHVVARVPLTEQVSSEWIRCYQRLALAMDVPVRAEVHAGRAWIVVRVPAGSSRAEVAETMDAARTLLAEADGATAGGHATADAEATIQDWWRRSAAREHHSRTEVVRTGIGAERRWTLAAALAVAIAALLLLPPRFRLGPGWLVPAAEALLLAATLAADRSHDAHRSAIVRALSFGLVFVLIAAAAFVTGRLVVDLVEGGPETNSAADLLEVAAGVWLYTIIAFVFLYWLADGRGPEARIWDPPEFPDLAFPQQLSPNVAPPGWRPEFPDYLYLGFTNATAFSPTDVMPLARWSKLAMTVQAAASLVILGLVVARAVNIFR
jgi:hypothetical protein